MIVTSNLNIKYVNSILSLFYDITNTPVDMIHYSLKVGKSLQVRMSESHPRL